MSIDIYAKIVIGVPRRDWEKALEALAEDKADELAEAPYEGYLSLGGDLILDTVWTHDGTADEIVGFVIANSGSYQAGQIKFDGLIKQQARVAAWFKETLHIEPGAWLMPQQV